MKRLAIIPARGGSKRVPRKNIRTLGGIPIIGRVIRTALEANIFDVVMVSTDDEEIARIARQFGAEVPFMRSSEAASDTASTFQVLQEVISTYKTQGQVFDQFVCIYATAGLIQPHHLISAFEKLNSDESIEGVITVKRFPHPPQRGLKISQGRLEMVTPAAAQTRTQDLEPIFYDAGQFYVGKVSAIEEQGTLWVKNNQPLVLSEFESQDIDNEEDWAVAEWKLVYQQKRS